MHGVGAQTPAAVEVSEAPPRRGRMGGGNRGTRGQICGDRNIILGGEHTCNIYDMLTQHLKLIRFC